MTREHVVTFTNQRGQRLVGILHEPAAAAKRDTAVILLSPGVKNRVAPHRMYNKLAAPLVDRGLWVLRFDFEGLGDADGAIGEPMMADLYRSIQLGRYVGDTHSSMDWLRRGYGIKRFVLGGLCGGAITGVLAAARRDDVAGIVGLGLPVMLDGSQSDKVANMTEGQLARIRTRYLAKLFDPRAWLRVLTLKTDFRLLVRSVLGKKNKPKAAKAPAAPAATAPQAEGQSNANPYFPTALEQTLTNGCPVLLMFSESDRLQWEFQEKFADSHGSLLQKHARLIDIRLLKEANHVLTFAEWQRDMIDTTMGWLEQRGLIESVDRTPFIPSTESAAV